MIAAEELSANSAYLSQIENVAPRARVALLGASNLSIMFPSVIEAALATFGRPLEFFVAKGFGRAYGQDSGFFGKKFSGILQSPILRALELGDRRETAVIISDIGNDLAYGAPPDQVAGWIDDALNHLSKSGVKVAMNNLPLSSIQNIGERRYRILRPLFFPRSNLSRSDMISRAEHLHAALEATAKERKIPAFTGEKSWYGFDPIHPRRRRRFEIWRRMLRSLAGCGAEIAEPRIGWSRRAELRALQSSNRSAFESRKSELLSPRRDRAGNLFWFF